jgi:hypothetical protein
MAIYKLNTAPNGLESAYQQTDYSFTTDAKTIVIRLDEENPDLLEYLEQIHSWAYITAWNPSSFPQADAYHHSQQQLLLDQLKGYKTCKGEGRGRDGIWPPEESYFVANISREKATALCKDFG